MNGPSEHLAWSELACKDGTPYPAQWRETRAVALSAVFEALRAAVGQPLSILSAYRTQAHNRVVGGARASQHVEGRALDQDGVFLRHAVELAHRAGDLRDAGALAGRGGRDVADQGGHAHGGDAGQTESDWSRLAQRVGSVRCNIASRRGGT